MTDFNGRTILVTGASGGIGGATVRQLIAANAAVIASGRSQVALNALAQETGCRPLAFVPSAPCSMNGNIMIFVIWMRA